MSDSDRPGPEGSGLTHSQTQILVGQRLHPQSPLYNMAFAFVFPAELRADLFTEAWRRVAGHSDALRTRIVEHAGGMRRVLAPAAGATATRDFTSHPDPVREFHRWCRERCARPQALDGDLVDSVLVRLDAGRTGWYLNQHHLITDAASTVLLYRRVASEYAALLGDGERPPELPDYYPTVAALASRAGDRTAAHEHWAARQTRAGRHGPPEGDPRQQVPPRGDQRRIPFYGHSADPVGTTASTRLTLELDEQRRRMLDRLAGEDGFVSLSPALSRYALFATLLLSWLHRISGRDELGFDAPVAGRPTSRAKRALGLFIEMFPFAATVEPRDTFRTLGARCLEEAKLFLTHALPGTSSPSGTAAGNVVLNFVPESFGDFAGLRPEVEWLHPGHGDSVHALRLQVHDFAGTGRTTLHFDFNDLALPDRFRRRSLRHFDKLLAAMLDDPDQPIAAVDVLTSEERQALAELNDTAAAPLPERTVIAAFLEQAAAAPGRVALRQGSSELTFGELREQTEALAATLVREGVEPGDRVAIAGRRSIHTVVAILAVLQARAAYVPIDPAYPQQRRESILRDCGARLVLGSAQADDMAGTTVLQVVEGVRAGRGAAFERRPSGLDDLAYVLYTSGSTGRPKGVLIEHGGLADYLEWAARQYVRGQRLRFPLFTSLSFDLTVTSLFLPLITGGELLIYPQPEGPVDSALLDVVGDDAVDFIKLTPSHLSLLLQARPLPARIRCVVVGGEDFKSRLAAAAAARLGGHVEITNEYGPTEAVVGCVAHRYRPHPNETEPGGSVPIGRPADHVQVEILNHAGSPVPEGVAGELWVSRYGLARGYLGLDELTAERFQAPKAAPSAQPLLARDDRTSRDRPWAGERRYRTGDRVRMLDSTTLEYLGRLDRQLKISGFRIEPAEIEGALLALPGIEQCAVVARRRQPPEPATADEIRHCVRCGLPSNHPRAVFDRQGVCGVCRSYEQVKEHAQGYFKTLDELRRLFAESARTGRPAYDCMMLLSGGKDSTYALCRLVDLGLSVYAFTLDNGFISEGAKANIRRVTEQLGVPVELATTPAMNAIFRDSLARFANVCQGCFKTIYTLSTQRARELGIPIIVTGLSRGQMFETRLTEEMFSGGRRSAEEIDAAVLAARKVYHRADDEVSRSLDVEIFSDDRIFEEIRFVDFYRYCDVGLSEMLAYLKRKVPWVRPEDTGRSTNCLINDLGIYVHKKQLGYHNYALPYSWDVRMGHKTRDEALAELDDEIDAGYVRRTLAEIGAEPEHFTADAGQPRLAAYYVAAREISDEELRARLAERLPSALMPAHLQRVDSLPLTAHGKLDEQALPRIEPARSPESRYRRPEGPVEEYLSDLWREQLGIERAGADDSFFQLGGTSLGAMEVMLRLCAEFDLDLPLETLFSHPTLSALARIAEDRILDDVAALDDAEQEHLLASSEHPA